MKLLPILSLAILIISCNTLNGKIEARKMFSNDTNKTVYLINTSAIKKFKFTIKQSTISENGEKTFKNDFYILEPGQEVELGKETEFYGNMFEYKITYDTLTKITNYNIQVKNNNPLVSDSTNNQATRIYKEIYFKNKVQITPFDYWAFLNDSGKVIDSFEINKIETLVYLIPNKIPDTMKAKRQSRKENKYEVTGQIQVK